MKPIINRRIRRSSSHEAPVAKKENQQEQSFFGNATQATFFQPATLIQRKCAGCEKEEKLQRVADKKEDEKKLMKKDDEKLERSAGNKEEERLQKKDAPGSAGGGANVSSYVNSLNGRGNPLPAKTNHFFSKRMGFDFSNVKVHTDREAAESAKAVNAKAYTIGNNIVFNEGEYNEESSAGKKLMAHELVHVLQNNSGTSCINREVTVDAGVPPAARLAKSALAEELEIIWHDKGETAFFARLQKITPGEYNDEDTYLFILDNLSGDSLWWAESLLSSGAETHWDIESKIELEMRSLPPSRGSAGVLEILKIATLTEKITVIRRMLPVLKAKMGGEFTQMLRVLNIEDMIEKMREGEKRMIFTDSHAMHFLKQELPADDYKIIETAFVEHMWTKLVGEGFDEKDDTIKENRFIAALKLVGYQDVNIARGGRKNPGKMKAGLNLDIYYHDHAAESGYLHSNTFNAVFPMDVAEPQFAEVIGMDAFQRESPVRTIMTIEHELEHTRHHKRVMDAYKKWQAKGDTKAFKDQLQKVTTAIMQMAKRRNDPQDLIDKNLRQAKVDGISKWMEKQKGISAVDKDLFKEAATSFHPKTEVLAGLSGFMSGFHLIPVKDLDRGKTHFDELTYYPAQKGYWAFMEKSTKKEYRDLLTGYYCNTLSTEHREAFDYAAANGASGAKTAATKDFFKQLVNIKCT